MRTSNIQAELMKGEIKINGIFTKLSSHIWINQKTQAPLPCSQEPVL